MPKFPVPLLLRFALVHVTAAVVELGTATSGDDAYLWTRARRDVDTDVDLWDAHRIGLGPATTHVYEQRADSKGDPLHD